MNRWTGIDTGSREIAARVSQTFGNPQSHGVGSDRYDRNPRCQFLEDECARAAEENDIRVAANDFGRQGFEAGRVLLSAIIFDRQVLSLDLPQPAKLGE